MRGKFITLEGIDGAGKSTHLPWLAELLESRGINVRVTREPGGTALGENLRALLLDPAQRLHPETEALLMFAARREHLDKVILAALDDGNWVLCDRFSDASFAYQAAGSGVEWSKIAALEAWVHPNVQPDITLYFDVSPEIARARLQAGRPADRFEQERSEFHAHVREAYLRRAAEHPTRMRVIDASREIAHIQTELRKIITSLGK
ncbi:MAG TPA: dTMP kinase [Burkholderiales bacterium]|nr:dTMP kinase [Burkholderiales bacterium]